MKDREREVKFCVRDLAALQARLERLGAVLLRPRTLERNLRFDTPDGALQRAHRVLRLRQDDAVRLTYKGPSTDADGVRTRQEIEVQVADFAAMRALLEALGYQVTTVYEKWRTVYALGAVEVMLDELPYGAFVELEGEEEAALREAAARLGLRWEAAVMASYLALFERLRRRWPHLGPALTFAALAGLPVSAQDLGVVYADETGDMP